MTATGTPIDTAAPPRTSAGTRLTHRVFLVRELGILVALGLLIGATAISNPRFLSAQSVKDLLLGSTILAILATGEAIVVITRNVDLSVGSVLRLSAFALAVVLCAGYYLRSYRSGRELYAIGSDPAAARLSGIAVGRRVFLAFVTSGALAGLAGVLYVARFGTLDANAGLGQELNVVAAVVVGGVAIFGGSGSVFGAALGALPLSTTRSAPPVLGVTPLSPRAGRRGPIPATRRPARR